MSMHAANATESDVKVRLRGVTKTFVDTKRGKETTALQSVSLSVAPGEFVSLLGPSGCGKSTVLNLVAGFEEVTQGEIVVNAPPRPGRAGEASAPGYGMVFQQPHLFPWLNVLDNIAFGPRMAGVPREARLEQAQRYVGLMGLNGFERHFPYELSGGMQQRVALARAWTQEPSLFLMDEPFGALDAQTRLLMQELLLKAWDTSRSTVMFVTHDIDEALFLSDRVLIFAARPGRVADEVHVGLERPRDYAAVIVEPRFVELKRHVLDVIRKETMRAMSADE
jgi:NitT/TauT family transport system ATP-binding protein